jgi:hypothetical protein
MTLEHINFSHRVLSGGTIRLISITQSAFRMIGGCRSPDRGEITSQPIDLLRIIRMFESMTLKSARQLIGSLEAGAHAICIHCPLAGVPSSWRDYPNQNDLKGARISVSNSRDFSLPPVHATYFSEPRSSSFVHLPLQLPRPHNIILHFPKVTYVRTYTRPRWPIVSPRFWMNTLYSAWQLLSPTS